MSYPLRWVVCGRCIGTGVHPGDRDPHGGLFCVACFGIGGWWAVRG